MEEVAEGSKGLVEKLRDDDKLQESLEIATEEFHSHCGVHETQTREGRTSFKEMCLHLASCFGRVRVPAPLANDERNELCTEKVKHARFRAYHFGITLKQKTSGGYALVN